MSCKECGKENCSCHKDGCSSGAAVVIKNATEYVNFRKVLIPASVGDETTNPPQNGAFSNVLLVYEATGAAFLYSSRLQYASPCSMRAAGAKLTDELSNLAK